MGFYDLVVVVIVLYLITILITRIISYSYPTQRESLCVFNLYHNLNL